MNTPITPTTAAYYIQITIDITTMTRETLQKIIRATHYPQPSPRYISYHHARVALASLALTSSPTHSPVNSVDQWVKSCALKYYYSSPVHANATRDQFQAYFDRNRIGWTTYTAKNLDQYQGNGIYDGATLIYLFTADTFTHNHITYTITPQNHPL